MNDVKHTPLPWKMVSKPNFDNSLVYTSVQPVNVDEDTMKPLAMMNGEHHICRMSHTAAEWRFNYHRANAAFIVRACNSHYELLEALKTCLDVMSCVDGANDCSRGIDAAEVAIAKAEGRS